MADKPPETFHTAPESAWNKKLGQMRVRLILSAEPRKFLASWDDRPQGTPPPPIAEASVIKLGTEFGAFVAFSDCPAGPDGKCDVRVTYQIFSPEGELRVEQPNLRLWTWERLPPGAIDLAQCIWVTNTEETDEPGKNILRAQIVNKLNGETLRLEKEFTFEK